VAELLRHAVATHWRPKAKPGTAKNFEGMIERTLIPVFGSQKLSALKRADVRTWHAGQTYRPRQANLDVAILRKAMAIALVDGLIAENPATGITPHPERRRDRVASDAELAALLNALDSDSIRPQAALLIRLLMLTGCRTGEWRTAEWTWLDPDGRTLWDAVVARRCRQGRGPAGRAVERSSKSSGRRHAHWPLHHPGRHGRSAARPLERNRRVANRLSGRRGRGSPPPRSSTRVWFARRWAWGVDCCLA
jgi:integrase